MAAAARNVVFLLAASDTSLLTTKVPPMSAARLKTALPNLLEEQLVCDPADVVMVSTPLVDGEITVAVADRLWLEALAKYVKDWPIKKISVYPSQLALAFHAASDAQAQTGTAFIEEKDGALELCLRQSAKHGLGLSLDQAGQAEALTMLAHLAGATRLEVYVASAELDVYQASLSNLGLEDNIKLAPLSWINRVAGISNETPDLMTAIAAEHLASFDWSKWRWPLRLAALLMLVNLVALNVEWFRQKREEQALKQALTQTFRNSFPKETVIQDPLKQMRQNVNISKRAVGQFAANDFAVLASQFAQVWDRLGAPGGVAGIEYKDRALLIKTKPNIQIPLDKLRAALAEQSLEISSSTDGTLRVSAGGKR